MPRKKNLFNSNMKSFLSYAWFLSMFARNTEKIETNLTATYFLTAQVHLYQLCEYKRMMHQAMHNILQKETSLYQLLLGLNLCHVTRPFEVYHCSKIYGNLYYQTSHNFFSLKTVGLF